MLTRILSAVVLIPLVLWVLFAAPFSVQGVVVALVGAGLVLEWGNLAGEHAWPRRLTLVLSTWLILGTATLFPSISLAALLPLLAAPFLTEAVLVYRGQGRPGGHALFLHAGLAYCILPLVGLLSMLRQNQGDWLVLWLLVIIWATDSGAYFTGRFLGRQTLAPHVSPKKTRAGLWGGLAGGVLAGGLLVHATPVPLPEAWAWGMALVLSALGQVGDLVESLLKREWGIKDSGGLIPGHGGLLDRLDSLLFTLPVYSLLVTGLAHHVG
ncbi:MAG: phosphatidate cytidylyltransferase [Magnetococcus sp. WYHC-3]